MGAKQPDVDPKMTKIMKILTIVAAVIFIGVMVGGTIWLVTLFNGSGITENVEKNIVPNMVGMTTEQAKDACSKAGLTYVVIAEEKSIEYEEGYIFKQMTQAGTKLPEGAKVQVHVSTGLKDITMPDVTGKEEKDAIKQLKGLGFKEKYIEVEYEEHQTVKKDFVIRTNPKADTVGNSKTEIIIYVSKGVGVTTVPDLVGKTKSQAKQLLEEAGLKGNPVEVESDEDAGIVLEQSHEKGTKVDKGPTIDYKVSRDDMVEIPKLSSL